MLERPGFTPSERLVGDHIEEALPRLQEKYFYQLLPLTSTDYSKSLCAEKTNRKIALLGRSMVNVVDIALRLGYLRMAPDMLIEVQDVNRFSPNELVILCTGSQGEPMAALARLASGTHRQVQVTPGDTVI